VTFEEHLPPPPVQIEPPRNPLKEIRVGAFLRGDAYVNPFHDLLSAFSRSGPKRPAPPPKPFLRRVVFEEDGIRNIEETKTDFTPYAEVDQLRLYFQGIFTELEFAGGQYITSLRVGYGGPDTPRRELEVKSSSQRARALCKFLLDRKVSFKEFYNGSRSFLLDTNLNYRRIQRIKREYGIEW
jgi:hypothetical protein